MAELKHSRFLALPPELRDVIYSYLLDPAVLIHLHPEDPDLDTYDFTTYRALINVNRLVSRESHRVFHNLNRFVRIATPWPDDHFPVKHTHRVPVVCKGPRAHAFQKWEAEVIIEAPDLTGLRADQGQTGPTDHIGGMFVTQVRDIAFFTQTWYESDLNRPGLNQLLHLTMRLRANQFRIIQPGAEYTTNGMSLAMQKMILTPFGKVKGLNTVRIEGEHDDMLESVMREEMDIPYTSAEECLDEATRFRSAGDASAAKQDYSQALEYYQTAFSHIHIRIDGRRRNIYGDDWFNKELASGLFQGQQGHMVRLVMRVQLVAAVMDCQLALGQYADAHYWGHRSITLMREAMSDTFDLEGDDEPIVGFPGSESVGLIYFRTAKAARLLDDKDEARKLCQVALAYLPSNQEVRQEWEGLRTGRSVNGGRSRSASGE